MQAFGDRAGSNKKEIAMEDVMLAIQAKTTTSFVTPPSQDVSQLLSILCTLVHAVTESDLQQHVIGATVTA